MGSAATGEAILDAVARVKRANPQARYCCDPVIGDVGHGVFVREGIPEFMKSRAVPAADVITPNQFELDCLSGRTTRTLEDARAAIDGVHALGPRHILVTSLHLAETPADSLDLLASGPDGAFRLRTPLLPMTFSGAGDAAAALFFAHLLRSGSAAEALRNAASSVFGVLKATAERGAREILLVEAQEELVRPTRIFAPERIG
jgi:pyridoxine kinase